MNESPHAPPPRAPLSDGRSGLLVRTLLAVARQRNELDETGCRLVLDLLHTAIALRRRLGAELGSEGLTELRFFVLVVLFALDPEPAVAADLAVHTGATRASVTAVLDHLETAGLTGRARDPDDRRVIYVRLTDAGRRAADRAMANFLRRAGTLARPVDAMQRESAGRMFAALLAEAAPPPAG